MKEFDLLKHYLNQISSKSIDFYPLDKELRSVVIRDRIELKIFGRTHADCLIGFWKDSIKDEIENCKIFWLDSEGEPNAFFANNIRQFISLLYFDTGFIYDTLTRIIRNSAATPMTVDEINKYQQSAAETYLNYESMKSFIRDALNIPIPTHPDTLIKDAYLENKIAFPYTVNNFR